MDRARWKARTFAHHYGRSGAELARAFGEAVVPEWFMVDDLDEQRLAEQAAIERLAGRALGNEGLGGPNGGGQGEGPAGDGVTRPRCPAASVRG